MNSFRCVHRCFCDWRALFSFHFAPHLLFVYPSTERAMSNEKCTRRWLVTNGRIFEKNRSEYVTRVNDMTFVSNSRPLHLMDCGDRCCELRREQVSPWPRFLPVPLNGKQIWLCRRNGQQWNSEAGGLRLSRHRERVQEGKFREWRMKENNLMKKSTNRTAPIVNFDDNQLLVRL